MAMVVYWLVFLVVIAAVQYLRRDRPAHGNRGWYSDDPGGQDRGDTTPR